MLIQDSMRKVEVALLCLVFSIVCIQSNDQECKCGFGCFLCSHFENTLLDECAKALECAKLVVINSTLSLQDVTASRALSSVSPAWLWYHLPIYYLYRL